MIEKMSKYGFLIYHKEYTQFLSDISELGVVHVIEKDEKAADEQSDQVTLLLSLSGRYAKACKALEKIGNEDKSIVYAPVDQTSEGNNLLTEFEKQIELKHSLFQRQQIIEKELDRLDIWGDFDLSTIEKLENEGWHINFFCTPESNFDAEWLNDFHAIEVGRIGSMIYFVTVTKVKHPEIDAEGIKYGSKSFSSLKAEYQTNVKEIKQIDAELAVFAQKYYKTLCFEGSKISDKLDFEKVLLATESDPDSKLMILEGWVPVSKEKPLVEYLQSKGILFVTDVSRPKDKVPVLLKNNKFSRLFEMIGELYSLPNYNEWDLTPFFAPFFVMFFGLCLGDCGYGLLFVILSIILMRKVDPSLKPIFQLSFWLGLGTVIFGFISGTFFGIPLLEVDWAWIQSAKRFMLDSNQLFNFALILGGVQILFGMVLKAISRWSRFGFKYSIDPFGWILCLVGNGIVFGLGHIGKLSPEHTTMAHYIVSGIGLAMMLLFNDPEASILSNIGGGLWGLYNRLTGILGDMLSYIRLFALGISGSVMGLVFNQLAINMAPDIPIVGQLVMILILLFGHSMNIFMSSLGAFVHPMRLTFVEFYNNSGFEGGGKKYNPFAKKAKVN